MMDSRRLKWSRFNIEVPLTVSRGKVILFNTLNRNLILMKQDTVDLVKDCVGCADDIVVSDLRRLGMLVDADLDEQSFMRYGLGRWKFSDEMCVVWISLGSKCNFNCNYCYQDSRLGHGELLTEGNWIRLLRFLDQRASRKKSSTLGVVLFGGEPLVNADLAIRVAKDLKGLARPGLNITVSLITNGSLFTPEIATRFRGYLDTVQVTLDGPRDIHDSRRTYSDGSGSYDAIISNLREAAVDYSGRLMLRTNLTEDTIGRLPEMLLDIETVGLKDHLMALDIAAEYDSQCDISRNGCETKITPSISRKIAEARLMAAKAGWRLGKSFVTGPCTFRQANGFAIDENLNVYKCAGRLYEEPDGYIDESGELKILSSRWYQGVASEPSCVTGCVYGPICYGGCRWMAGPEHETKCNRANLDATIGLLIEAYALSQYRDKILDGEE